MTRTIRLLVPTATPAGAAETTQRAPRPGVVRTLAFMHNGQPQYDPLATALLDVLRGQPGVVVREYRKPAYGSPAEPALLDEIARGADAALVGLAC